MREWFICAVCVAAATGLVLLVLRAVGML